jgi:hypothetical protein
MSIQDHAKEFALLVAMRRFQPKTDMDRLLLAAHARLIETLTDGKPTTPWPTTQNP